MLGRAGVDIEIFGGNAIMDQALAHDIGLLVLRLSVAYVYLHGALMIAGNADRRRLTAERSSVLLHNTRLSGNSMAGRLLAAAATSFMVAGGCGLILGFGTRIAACLLIAFTIPGIVVHLRELAGSIANIDAIAQNAPTNDRPVLDKVRWSLYAGHRSSANKNYALIGAAAFLLLASDPNGRFSLVGVLAP